jgi:hypothetical protein
MRDRETAKLKMLKPFARRAKGRISTVYDTMRGVKAILYTESAAKRQKPIY